MRSRASAKPIWTRRSRWPARNASSGRWNRNGPIIGPTIGAPPVAISAPTREAKAARRNGLTDHAVRDRVGVAVAARPVVRRADLGAARKPDPARRYKPNSLRPGWSSGRRPSGQKNFRSAAAIGKSLMLACRCVM